MWTKAVTCFEQFHRYWKEMCGYAEPFNQPVATMAASRLTSPKDKVRVWKLSPQGAALLRATVKRIDMTGYVLLHQDASEFLH